MENRQYRRVVTGLDDAGRSRVMIDGPLVPMAETAAFAWRTATLPADNAGVKDIGTEPFSFEDVHAGGSAFMLATFAPGPQGRWHTTDTIDYIVLLEGELTLVTDTGEAALRPGDFIVDRGVNHAWRNDGNVPARAVVVMLPAHPVGAGKTV